MENRETVLRARKGDSEAFGRLIDERRESLYRTAYSFTKNRDDALDIVHDTVYKAFVSLPKLKNPDYFQTWLTRILINTAIDFTKKQKRAQPADTADIAAPTGSDNEERLDLYAAVDRLPEMQKAVVILKYLHDLTLTEVADILRCPPGTVKTHLHKALKTLRMELKEE